MRCIDAGVVADDQGVTPPLKLVAMVTLPSSSHSWSHPLSLWLSHMNTHSHTCAAFSKISVWGLILGKLHKRRKSFLHETKFVMLPENWTCKYIIYCRRRRRSDNFRNEIPFHRMLYFSCHKHTFAYIWMLLLIGKGNSSSFI